MSKHNRILEAMKESYNTVGIAGAVALSAALLNPLPLLAALVAEAAYLLFVPDSKWYAERLSKRYDAEIEQQRQLMKAQTLTLLRPEMQERFAHLEDMRRQIDAQSAEDKAWFREVLRKLDYLLDKFLLFAGKEVQFRAYLEQLQNELPPAGGTGYAQNWNVERDRNASRAHFRDSERETPHAKRRLVSDMAAVGSSVSADDWTQKVVGEIQAHYAQEADKLGQSLAAERDDATRSILQKRTDILQRRNEFVGKIGRILVNLNHQLQLVEDTFGLINDEIRARSPEQILADVEEVVVATDTMASSLQELASVEQMMARLAS